MQTLELNLSDLVRRSAGQGGEAPSTRPMMVAQRIELMRRHAQYGVSHAFRPGELVMEKEGLSYFRADARPTLALIYWRSLDFGNFADRRVVAEFYDRGVNNDRVNCIVGRLSDDGETILFMPHDARKLRPLNEGEIAELAPFLGDDAPDQSDPHAPAEL